MDEQLQKTAQAGGGRENSLPRLTYKLNEAAFILGISTMSVRRLVDSGSLKSVRRLRHQLIPAAELERFAARAK